jgi:hypothetical protein
VAIETAANHEPPAVLLYLADSADTSQRVRPLLVRTGSQPWYVGDISRSNDIEIFGRYNQVTGHLGRTVLDTEEFVARFGPEQLPAH